ncbi:RNA polymerase sigma factor [Spirosoma lituiforme]
MYKLLTDEELIRQLLPSQPNQCFETLYTRYIKKVYCHCLSVVQDSDKAQDFSHDIFLRVFDKLDAFQQRSTFSTWLYSISYNYCSDQIKLAKRLQLSSLDNVLKQDIPEPQDVSLHEETLQRVNQALATLPDEDRTLLRLKYEQGMSLDEIAKLYTLKLSTVKMRLKRGREKVQRLCI